LAVGGAPVAAYGIAIVAGFIRPKNSVSTGIVTSGGLTGLPLRRANPAIFDEALAGAPVAVLGIAIVTLFILASEVVLANDAVAADADDRWREYDHQAPITGASSATARHRT